MLDSVLSLQYTVTEFEEVSNQSLNSASNKQAESKSLPLCWQTNWKKQA